MNVTEGALILERGDDIYVIIIYICMYVSITDLFMWVLLQYQFIVEPNLNKSQ